MLNFYGHKSNQPTCISVTSRARIPEMGHSHPAAWQWKRRPFFLDSLLVYCATIMGRRELVEGFRSMDSPFYRRSAQALGSRTQRQTPNRKEVVAKPQPRPGQIGQKWTRKKYHAFNRLGGYSRPKILWKELQQGQEDLQTWGVSFCQRCINCQHVVRHVRMALVWLAGSCSGCLHVFMQLKAPLVCFARLGGLRNGKQPQLLQS